ncbi:MAG: TetR/AcrR family transcriptional regulator [Solirubrobacterales bacterium]
MSPRKPVQQRSRDRIEQILLGAADLLAKTGDTDDLTTTSVSKRSGVPVATIYRYFADRMAIITTLIDRETIELDDAVAESLDQLDTVTPAILLETLVVAHLRHFQASRRSIVLWFGARQSSRVLARVDRRYKYIGAWVYDGSVKSGLVVDDAPAFGGELLIWMGDRVFEFMFREERSSEEQEAILREYIDTMTSQIGKYLTPLGKRGIPMAEFIAQVGEYKPIVVEDH